MLPVGFFKMVLLTTEPPAYSMLSTGTKVFDVSIMLLI
jgi:hypothetical protein